jgi:hypothetical protein
MAKFFIQGNLADVCAGLKTTLDAQDANFKAQLNAVVKLAPPPAKSAPAVKPSGGKGSLLGTNRNRRFGG